MRTVRQRRLHALAVLALATIAGCGGTKKTEPSSSITVSMGSGTLQLSQGLINSITATIALSNFSGTIALAATGLPAGVTAVFSPPELVPGINTATLILTATSTATPGTATITVSASSAGVDTKTATFDLTVLVTGTYTLTAAPTTRSVTQGSTTTTTLTVTRSGGMAQDVALTASGLPTGVTAAFNPATLTTSASTSTVTLTASASATAGLATVTFTGTTPGLTNRTATLSLTVEAPGATSSFSGDFCASEIPVWFAYQNTGGAWTQLTPDVNGTVTGQLTSKVALAIVWDHGADGYEMQLMFATTDELASINGKTCIDDKGTKSLSGSVANVPNGKHSTVNMSWAYGHTDPPATTYSLTELPNGAIDLVSSRAALSLTSWWVPDAVIIRRSLDLASASTIPLLDFNAAEAFAPSTHTLTVNGPVGDGASARMTFITRVGTTSVRTFHDLWFDMVSAGTATFSAIPVAQQLTGDLHDLGVMASSGGSSFWMADAFFKTPGNKTLTLGSQLSTPTYTQLSTAPYVRYRAQLASQSEYGAMALFYFSQASNSVGVIVTSGYMGTTPATWDVSMPDFASVSGWQNTWGLQSGVSTDRAAQAYSNAASIVNDDPPPDGTTVTAAGRSDNTTSAGAAGHIRRADVPGRLLAPRVFRPLPK